ncbi:MULTISPECIES: hypothetical protein [unclassified Rhizobium]|uniref:hypothetical protein n=1 Tax=unclassified Rhizobium TaxID=2613769 RepID=UPI0017CA1AD3|nr:MULTISPECIES: hypothetical protein [unclassified Rhizobium]MBB4171817.1 outer membrane murein-binding lipoprotein Lpp [Rhizobium sp. BK538]
MSRRSNIQTCRVRKPVPFGTFLLASKAARSREVQVAYNEGRMVTAISNSSTSTTLLSTSASSSSSDDAASIKQEIASKKAELASTKDQNEAQALQGDISTLEAKLAKLEKSSNTASGQQGGGQPPRLSGEGDRIGTKNFDDDSEFGERVAYV